MSKVSTTVVAGEDTEEEDETEEEDDEPVPVVCDISFIYTYGFIVFTSNIYSLLYTYIYIYIIPGVIWVV
jgi:hypothetical protein